MKYVLAAAICLMNAPAMAAKGEFPQLGVFGVAEEQGCESAKKEEEGSYISFDKGLSTGEGGQGGCDYKRIEPTGKNAYRLTGICKPLEGPGQKVSAILVIKDADHLTYRESDYVRCKGVR